MNKRYILLVYIFVCIPVICYTFDKQVRSYLLRVLVQYWPLAPWRWTTHLYEHLSRLSGVPQAIAAVHSYRGKTQAESRSRFQHTRCNSMRQMTCSSSSTGSSSMYMHLHTLSTLPDFALVKNQCMTWPSCSRTVSTRDSRSFSSGKLSCHKFFIIHHDNEPATSDSWLSASPSSSMGTTRCVNSTLLSAVCV